LEVYVGDPEGAEIPSFDGGVGKKLPHCTLKTKMMHSARALRICPLGLRGIGNILNYRVRPEEIKYFPSLKAFVTPASFISTTNGLVEVRME
jgi:hypothetical protein